MWVLPSLNRYEQLHQCLSSIVEIGISTSGEVILGPDQDHEISKIRPLPEGWRVRCQHRDDRSLVDVLNRFVRDNPDLPFYGYLQDDLTFKTRNWDKQLIAAAGNNKIASCNDNWRAPKRNTGACAFGGDLIRAWGFWGPPMLQHYYLDDFWEENGRQFKNWVVLMDVVTPHRHFANPRNKAPFDATYKFSRDLDPIDRRQWKTFRTSRDYMNLVARVRELLADHRHLAVG